MPRKRKQENKGLPTRCRWLYGSIYYDVPKGMEHDWDGKKLFKLGKTIPEAFRELAMRAEVASSIKTIGELFDRYILEVIPTKAPRNAEINIGQVSRLRKVFGDMPIGQLEPPHIYQYYDRKIAKVAAKREIALLSHAFTKAVEWGYIRTHPFKGQIRLKGSKPRERYIEDWEIEECLNLESRPGDIVRAIQAYIRIKWLTGLRGGDLLSLKMSDLSESGIYVKPRKTQNSTGRAHCISWTEELRSAVDAARNARPVDISPFLFCNKRGESYINQTGYYSGWNSSWQRFMKRVLKETKVKEHFTSHDIRAKNASDAKNIVHAQEMMGHSDPRITEHVYRRKIKVIEPLR